MRFYIDTLNVSHSDSWPVRLIHVINRQVPGLFRQQLVVTFSPAVAPRSWAQGGLDLLSPSTLDGQGLHNSEAPWRHGICLVDLSFVPAPCL